jgi:hypothetical protein
MLRFKIAAAVVAAGALCLALAGSASAQLTRPAEPQITCASGYSAFKNYPIDLTYPANGISSNGLGNPLYIGVPNASCWKAIDRYKDPLGGYGYQYVNEGGNCMWLYDGYVRVNTCVDGDAAEQFYGVVLDAGGWIIANQTNGWNLTVVNCAAGDDVTLAGVVTPCDEWTP